MSISKYPLICFHYLNVAPLKNEVMKSSFSCHWFSGPSAAPQNLRSIHTTSTSIFVIWDEVFPDEQNGIIISYNVSYWAIRIGSAGPFFSKLVRAPTRHVNLTGLTKDMHYNIIVLASTIKGDGIYSNPKTLRTNEDSKSVFFNYVNKITRYSFLLLITSCGNITKIGSGPLPSKTVLVWIQLHTG